MYCSNCGAEVTGNFCQNCGAPINSDNAEKQEENSNNIGSTFKTQDTVKNPVKQKKKSGCFPALLILILFVVFVNTVLLKDDGRTSSDSLSEQENVKPIIKAETFSNITVKELKELMGEPESKEKWEYDTGVGKYNATTYTYNEGEYEFLVIKKKVVRLTVNLKVKQKVQSDSHMMSLFGITAGEDCCIVADTGSALRYQMVSDKVDEFWIPVIENDKYDMVKITYNQMLFGSLPIADSEESKLQLLCQRTVESILKSPSTAKFPNILKWNFWKQKEGIYVQAYVDAENGFGANVRSEFQFILDEDYTIKSLIFDGEEMIK